MTNLGMCIVSLPLLPSPDFPIIHHSKSAFKGSKKKRAKDRKRKKMSTLTTHMNIYTVIDE